MNIKRIMSHLIVLCAVLILIVAISVFHIRDNYTVVAENLYVGDAYNNEEIQYALPIRRTLPACDRRLVPENMPFISDMLSFPELTKDELTSRSSLVIRGVITGVSYPFFVEDEFGHRQLFTEYYVEVREILRGETFTSEIAVRLQGGVTESFIHLVDCSPEFNIGEEYLLFLTIPTGEQFDTFGYYYYYLTLGPQSVFQHVLSVSREVEHFSYGEYDSFVQYGRVIHDVLGFSELKMEIERINNVIPVPTAQDLRQKSADAVMGNVERGVLTMSDDELEELIYEILNQRSTSRVVLVD